MSVQHFIPTVWSKKIQDALEIQCKLVQNCNLSYEGDVQRAGSVKILGVGEPTVKDYDRKNGITPEELSDEGQTLNIDQAKAFAFYVDDIDKAQSVPGLPEEYQSRSVHGLAVARDTYVANLIKDATNQTLAEGLTELAIKAAIDEAIVELRERNFDEPGVIEISPLVYKFFKNQLITLSTDNPEYIKRGIVGMYDDLEVVRTNNLAKDDTYRYCCVRGKKAIAFAGQINEVEALRSTTHFADIVRGLDTFGAKVTDEKRIQTIKFPLVAG